MTEISEIRHITLASKQFSLDDDDRTLIEIMRTISFKIMESAMMGKSKALIDLKDTTLHPKTNQFLKQVANELQLNGYGVEMQLTRTLNGARSMTISW